MDDAHDNFNWSHYKIFVRTRAYANLSPNKQTETKVFCHNILTSYMQSIIVRLIRGENEKHLSHKLRDNLYFPF